MKIDSTVKKYIPIGMMIMAAVKLRSLMITSLVAVSFWSVLALDGRYPGTAGVTSELVFSGSVSGDGVCDWGRRVVMVQG